MASYRKIFRHASAKAQIFSQKYSKRNQLPPKNGLSVEDASQGFPSLQPRLLLFLEMEERRRF